MFERETRLAKFDSEVWEVAELVVGAESGDAEALAEVKERFGASPAAWTGYEKLAVDLAGRAERALLAIVAGDKLVTREAIKHRLAEMRTELAGPHPTILDRLLADRVAICWLQLQHAEATYVQAMQRGISWGESQCYEKRLDRAQKRFLSATRTLATVRRAQLPAVQVNIAEKQLNVIG